VSCLLIANPWASGVTERRLDAVRRALPEEVELRLTSREGEAIDLAREASGEVSALYVFGGDGTFNEVLNGVDAATPVGFVPGGGASVLPRALGLPRDPVECARVLADRSQERRIAVGRANGRRFGFACGVGFDAEVVRAVDRLGRRSDGRRPGNLRFAWTGVRTLARSRFSLEPALEVVGHGRAALALISNGPVYTYAGPAPVRFAHEASFERGLDLVAPERVRARELPGLARHAFGRAGGAPSDTGIFLRDADRLEIVCDRPLPLEVDGEDLGDVEHVLVEAERQAVTVLVPET
jgi:diacylglycerol kinase family enzyme